jgi:hypothetical protein
MNVRQLIQNLMSMDMDAEVMVEARKLSLPVRSITPGIFPYSGKNWVVINGTEVWGLNQGVEKNDQHIEKKPLKCLSSSCEELALDNSNYCSLCNPYKRVKS